MKGIKVGKWRNRLYVFLFYSIIIFIIGRIFVYINMIVSIYMDYVLKVVKFYWYIDKICKNMNKVFKIRFFENFLKIVNSYIYWYFLVKMIVVEL